MYTDLKKTLAAIGRCLPDEGEPTQKQLHRMYDETLWLMSQELAVIYDRETFGSHPAEPELLSKSEVKTGGQTRFDQMFLR